MENLNDTAIDLRFTFNKKKKKKKNQDGKTKGSSISLVHIATPNYNPNNEVRKEK